MQLQYDFSVNALYVKLSAEPVARTVEVDGNTNVDLDQTGALVGIEVISTNHSWPVGRILQDYSISDSEREQLETYFGGQFEAQDQRAYLKVGEPAPARPLESVAA